VGAAQLSSERAVFPNLRIGDAASGWLESELGEVANIELGSDGNASQFVTHLIPKATRADSRGIPLGQNF
jgi:hypothetical protein